VQRYGKRSVSRESTVPELEAVSCVDRLKEAEQRPEYELKISES
jgi:hypothetical protein